MTITDEQAVKIAKWLGAKKLSQQQIDEYISLGLLNAAEKDTAYWDFELSKAPFHLCGESEIKDWLYSAEGHEALIQAVLQMIEVER